MDVFTPFPEMVDRLKIRHCIASAQVQSKTNPKVIFRERQKTVKYSFKVSFEDLADDDRAFQIVSERIRELIGARDMENLQVGLDSGSEDHDPDIVLGVCTFIVTTTAEELGKITELSNG